MTRYLALFNWRYDRTVIHQAAHWASTTSNPAVTAHWGAADRPLPPDTANAAIRPLFTVRKKVFAALRRALIRSDISTHSLYCSNTAAR